MPRKNDPIDLSPDPIVALLKKSEKAGLRLHGYLGERADGKVRMYWDVSMRSYYLIEETDIIARTRVGESSLLVVKFTAHLEAVAAAPVDAEWLEGVISAEYLQMGEAFCVGMNPPTTHTTRDRKPPTTRWWPPTTVGP